MRLPTNILVPIDFSDSAEAALDYAVGSAARLDARIHLKRWLLGSVAESVARTAPCPVLLVHKDVPL